MHSLLDGRRTCCQFSWFVLSTFKIIALLFAVGSTFVGSFLGAADIAAIQRMSLSKLEERIVEIEEELEPLAHFSLNNGVAAIGYRSMPFTEPHHPEWVQVDLGGVYRVDQVVLVPTVFRDMSKGYVADAFPLVFRLVAGVDGDTEGQVIAEIDYGDSPPISIAPQIFPVDPIEASWIRLEAVELGQRLRDGKYVLQLAEIMVFEGGTNQALRKLVTTSRNIFTANAWKPPWLVDGILPYAMNSSKGKRSLPMMSRVGIGDQATIEIDLGEVQTVNRLRLHTVDQGDTVPQSYPGDFGIPEHFVIEGANEPDFSDAISLLEVFFDGVYQKGPIMEWSFPETRFRYFRFVALRPYFHKSEKQSGTRIGFAEIELLDGAHNVAFGKTVSTDFRLSSAPSSRAELTDGHNLYGELIPIREWMDQLALRRDLEEERPLIAAELSLRYAQQRMNLRLLVWFALLLIVVIAITIFYFRRERERQEVLIRERIAANLHDELGANLHAIGLLGDLAKDAVDSKEDLIDTVNRIRALTVRTGKAASNCSNLLEAAGFCDDLVTEMRQEMSHLLGDLEHTFTVEGEAVLKKIRRRTRLDLYLFFKETITNIIRHSAATTVEIKLTADANYIHLTVTDNGDGMDEIVPKALTRRARLLRAEFYVDKPETGHGTRIRLIIKRRKIKFF